MGDWIFTTLAWVLLAIGVLGLAWALLWDRARGRRRCPGCWYGLDGVPEADGATTCPECGKQTSNPRRLFRTRRRWGLAVLALVPLAGAYASHAYPIVRDHGWWRIAPDIVLIALVPRIEGATQLPASGPGTNPLYNEVWRRTATDPHSKHHAWWSTGGLWPWERWLLRRQSLTLLGLASRPDIEELAARLLAISTDDPVPLVAQEHKGVVVLAWSKLRYENCQTYVDIGVATRHYPSMPEFSFEDFALSPQIFLSAFERGVRIHQETCQRVTWSSDWSHRTSWRGPDGQVFEWWNFRDGVEEDDAYYGACPVGHVYDALDPVEEWGSILDWLSGSEQLAGVQTIRGRACYHVIEAGADPDERLELWIDQETGLVRQQYFGNMLFHYESAFDVELDASWHAFDPKHPDRSPLMQRLDEIDALLPEHDLLEPIDPGG